MGQATSLAPSSAVSSPRSAPHISTPLDAIDLEDESRVEDIPEPGHELGAVGAGVAVRPPRRRERVTPVDEEQSTQESEEEVVELSPS